MENIEQCLHLFSSMIDSKEDHSILSTDLYDKAKFEIIKVQDALTKLDKIETYYYKQMENPAGFEDGNVLDEIVNIIEEG